MGRSKAGKTRNNPDKQLMEAAVQEVVEGKLSLRGASRKYGISKSAIERSVKKFKGNTTPGAKFKYIPKYDIHKIFTPEQESDLRDYLILAAQHNYGLTRIELKKTAYQYAVANQIPVPQWEAKKSAGQGWLRMFRKRHPNISLRKPEATSLSRATAFNKTNVQEFFTKYKEVLSRKEYHPHQIWNIDETGLSTVHAPPKVFASKGSKQVGNMSSAERGTNVTMIAAINAAGNSVPPLFVFPRVHFKPMMLKGAPPGSIGAANRSGWSNEEIFKQYIEHFINHVRPTNENSHIIILDNHESHYSPQVISRAKEVGIVILTLPPHCSHKMQPLDRTVFGPFKSFYNKAMNDWMNSPNNAKRPVNIYDLPELAGIAYELAFSIKNIVSGFKATGIMPLNSNIFDESDFMPSNVTDRPLPIGEEAGPSIPPVSEEAGLSIPPVSEEAGPSTRETPILRPSTKLSTAANINVPLIFSSTSSKSTNTLTLMNRSEADIMEDNIKQPASIVPNEEVTNTTFTPEMIRPFPKAAPRKMLTRRRIGKSRIITDTPEEIEIKKSKESKRKNATKEMHVRKKRVTKKLWPDSSEDEDEEMALTDKSSDYDVEEEINNYEIEKKIEHDDIAEGDYVLVQCTGEKNKEHFVAKIVKSRKIDFDVIYLRKMHKTDTFIIQEEEEPQIYTLQMTDIIIKLPPPESVGSTKRSSNHIKFGINFSGFNMR